MKASKGTDQNMPLLKLPSPNWAADIGFGGKSAHAAAVAEAAADAQGSAQVFGQVTACLQSNLERA
jgi:hypothetical protein